MLFHKEVKLGKAANRQLQCFTQGCLVVIMRCVAFRKSFQQDSDISVVFEDFILAEYQKVWVSILLHTYVSVWKCCIHVSYCHSSIYTVYFWCVFVCMVKANLGVPGAQEYQTKDELVTRQHCDCNGHCFISGGFHHCHVALMRRGRGQKTAACLDKVHALVSNLHVLPLLLVNEFGSLCLILFGYTRLHAHWTPPMLGYLFFWANHDKPTEFCIHHITHTHVHCCTYLYVNVSTSHVNPQFRVGHSELVQQVQLSVGCSATKQSTVASESGQKGCRVGAGVAGNSFVQNQNWKFQVTT